MRTLENKSVVCANPTFCEYVNVYMICIEKIVLDYIENENLIRFQSIEAIERRLLSNYFSIINEKKNQIFFKKINVSYTKRSIYSSKREPVFRVHSSGVFRGKFSVLDSQCR